MWRRAAGRWAWRRAREVGTTPLRCERPPEPSRVGPGHRAPGRARARAVPYTENTVHNMKGWTGELAGPGRERKRSGSVPRAGGQLGGPVDESGQLARATTTATVT